MAERSENKNLLEVEHLKMYFPIKTGSFGKRKTFLKAVDDVSFCVPEGKTFGLVGESGCGKTTVGKCILRAYQPSEGMIRYQGQDIARLPENRLKGCRRSIQLIFQDPYSSLDPRQYLESILKEALLAGGERYEKDELNERIDSLLGIVELDRSMRKRYAHEMSGGQRQRLGIARALACSPRLIVCDEPVSALDVSIQAQIINLFRRLQEEQGLTYVFIAHDLAVVKHIADMIAVLYLGHIVEIVNSEELYDHPQHPYTQALLSAVPTTDYYVEKSRTRIILDGEVPSPLKMPKGCPFHPRCAYAEEICRNVRPELQETGPEHRTACHYACRDVNAAKNI